MNGAVARVLSLALSVAEGVVEEPGILSNWTHQTLDARVWCFLFWNHKISGGIEWIPA